MDRILKVFRSKRIGPYTAQIHYRPKQRVGHFDFSLHLRNEEGKLSSVPSVKGLYSKGNISQNMEGWFDIHYSDQADFGEGNPVILSQFGRCAEYVFQILGEAILPGGMIFVSLITDMVWEIDSELHRVTRGCLSTRSLRIPPGATPLGRLLFISGCRNIKSQAYDVQGSSRLAGEKAPHPEMDREFSRELKEQLHEFLSRSDRRGWAEQERICRLNAEDVLNRMSKGL